MSKRKEQFRKQQIATSGHSDKFTRRDQPFLEKVSRLRALDKTKEANNE